MIVYSCTYNIKSKPLQPLHLQNVNLYKKSLSRDVMKRKQGRAERLNKPLIRTVYNVYGKRCPDCQGKEFYNFDNVYIICSKCGLIISSREPTTKGAGFYKPKIKPIHRREQLKQNEKK